MVNMIAVPVDKGGHAMGRQAKTYRYTPLGRLIKAAMEAKGRAELGNADRYTLRDLEKDSGVSHAHSNRVMLGQRQISREMLAALIRALAPHLDAAAAEIEAGYMPSSRGLADLIRTARRIPAALRRDADAMLSMAFLRDSTEQRKDVDRVRQDDADHEGEHDQRGK